MKNHSRFQATIEINTLLLSSKCLDLYIDTMRKEFNGVKIYVNVSELVAVHEKIKNDSIFQV